ncbi:hypothetical protein KI387_013346, partial [Taxus chinensis]
AIDIKGVQGSIDKCLRTSRNYKGAKSGIAKQCIRNDRAKSSVIFCSSADFSGSTPAKLPFASGLCLSTCCELQVDDVNFFFPIFQRRSNSAVLDFCK